MPTVAELQEYISLIAGDIYEEELSASEFEKIIKKAMITYNAYCPEEGEFITTISGTLFSGDTAGHQFAPPYPRIASVIPQYAGMNWAADISTATYTYNSNTGVLTVPITGTYIVKYVTDVTLFNLNEVDHPLFYKLLEAYYKIIVGGRRKRFRLMDNQIENDGETLIEEGNNMLQEIREDLADNVPFWLALSGR